MVLLGPNSYNPRPNFQNFEFRLKFRASDLNFTWSFAIFENFILLVSQTRVYLITTSQHPHYGWEDISCLWATCFRSWEAHLYSHKKIRGNWGYSKYEKRIIMIKYFMFYLSISIRIMLMITQRPKDKHMLWQQKWRVEKHLYENIYILTWIFIFLFSYHYKSYTSLIYFIISFISSSFHYLGRHYWNHKISRWGIITSPIQTK